MWSVGRAAVPVQKESEVLRTVLLRAGVEPGRPRYFQEGFGSERCPLQETDTNNRAVGSSNVVDTSKDILFYPLHRTTLT